ncbi:hypothetical protein RND71_028774 [Anisodus tanguticus]|uniref:Myb-like domain-containing protein n=1 Tax=Anisodus tanguticus TaxID=243964 RepID=A0AAE1RLL1_9SOLA|nr:hypothetical protein RND71_028774 [Anisodus tanguticus]
MAGIHHQRNQQQQQVEEQQQQQRFIVENASTSSPFFPTYHHFPHPLLQQIHHIPFTQQFFQYQQHPHYRSMLDHQQHQEIRLEPSPEGESNEVQSVSGTFFPLCFKLGMEGDSVSKASNGGGYEEEGGIRQEDALIRGSEGYCTQPRQTSLAVSHWWQNQEDSAIKQPFWKPLSAEFSNGNNNNSNERENKDIREEDQEMYPPEEIHHHQQIIKSLEENKCRVLFGELEAIYATNAAAATTTNIHRIASESVLSADNLPTNHNVSFPVAFNDSNQASVATTTTAAGIYIGSESASVGGREAEAEAEATRGEVHKRKRKKKAKELGTSDSMSGFFESLVKKLVNHQEDLHKRLVETIERLDEERIKREEAWREQKLANLQKEEAARAHERTLAREATLVSYLEKLTGQKINFPQPIKNDDKSCSTLVKLNNKRWPQAEVEALVQIRTSLESKFQEPVGPKRVLWEEISNSMASMGFQRSARRCKEKWENMHKCTVKKTKEITREQFNSSTATIDFVNQGNDTVDHLVTVNLPEGNNGEKDKHVNGEFKNGSGKEDMEELKE